MPGKPSSVLVIGSGPIIIGQAAEFDYAGTQACRALREEGIRTILVNSNPATIMTDPGVADAVYLEPLTLGVVSEILRRERPEGLLGTLGGQTGLNLTVALSKTGILEELGVRPLGTPVSSIIAAEDREEFKQLLIEIGEPVPPSVAATTVQQAMDFAAEIGYPVVVRPAFTLGGTGGGFADTPEELERLAEYGLQLSPVGQVLVERSLMGWKELEYEVMRDADDTCVVICNMENIDPMGVHTGDSIVVAPSQTLSDREYQMLRAAALRIIRALKIEGGCNCQFALDPHSEQYYVIEVNPRVSRSSALASKATGYPIARVATKIAIGGKLAEIRNTVTGKTTAAFEPSIDYLVVKIPRWPFDKFRDGDRVLGTQMKATGEVMAIDRCFEAALQKAVRSLDVGDKPLSWEDPAWHSAERIPPTALVKQATDQRIWALMAALRRGQSVDEVAAISLVDRFFLVKLSNIVAMERRLLAERLTPDLLWDAKRLGFSDAQIAELADSLEDRVRELRKAHGIIPAYKMVDTCAAEFDAETPYFYSTYEDENEAEPMGTRSSVVLGAGPIRIGQGIEFDYCSVRGSSALRDANVPSILINNNPETVSTDFDASSRLYFEPLDAESVLDILENESSEDGGLPSVAAQFGGQTAINLAEPLEKAGVHLLGGGRGPIDVAEDRRQFELLAAELGVPQPPGAAVTTTEDALHVASTIGYPVIVRPSYVLGGRAMEIVYNEEELLGYLRQAGEMSFRRPVLVDKYLEGREVEVDAISDGTNVLIPGIMEHIERAGVHSGDSMAVYPTQRLTEEELERIADFTERLAMGLQIRGLFNIQFVVFQGQVLVLEVNPRSSRTVPFLSKITDIPMVDIAVRAMLGDSIIEQGYKPGLARIKPLVAVKAPVFSTSKLRGVDSYLGPEMRSTGEVIGLGRDEETALIKALTAASLLPKPEGGLFISVADRDKDELIPLARQAAALGYTLYATQGTKAALERGGIVSHLVHRRLDEGHPNSVDLIERGQVVGVVNTVSAGRGPLRDGFEIRRAAVERGVPCFTSLDTFRAVMHALSSPGASLAPFPLDTYLKEPVESEPVGAQA